MQPVLPPRQSLLGFSGSAQQETYVNASLQAAQFRPASPTARPARPRPVAAEQSQPER
jgi:hypothetical protein